NNPGATITYAGTDITVQGNFTQNGTFDLTGKTISFTGDFYMPTTITCTGELGGSVKILKSGNATTTIVAGCIVTVTEIDTHGNIENHGTINHTGSLFQIRMNNVSPGNAA